MLQKWKSCLPFLAGFCLWQIVPLATFDLKNLAGKGQNISRNRSWVSSQVSCHSRARGCQVGPPGHSVKCSCLRSPGTCPGSVEAVEECVCVQTERENSELVPVSSTPAAVKRHWWSRESWEVTPMELEGRHCQGIPLALSGGVIPFSSYVSKDGCLSFPLSLN